MNNKPSTSMQNVSAFDDEIFEDSTILANFNNSTFRDTNTRFSESNLNYSHNKSELNVSALCCDKEISGYDKLTGQTWIYPTNYPVRDYQFNIIKAAILKNTLVSLPTGLGKTFIAAVIMYNFYRWYPLGKIIFTAPTRPLVAQQIEACYNIVAIPTEDTVEMTGHMQVTTRKTHWQSKRVFFATPQVIYNDIKSGICPGDQIRCLVIDEAHKARGNYAYCQIVGALTDKGCKTYRVLALSATPGSKVDDVINVVKNLHIAHLELRTENCIDVAPYSHARKVSTVVIPLGTELTQLKQHYIEILDEYARRLKQLNILPLNLGNLSKGRVVMMYKEFQNRERGSRHPQHNFIMKDFTLLIALFHGLELLTKHGSRVFLNFFDEHPEKSWIQADDRLTALLERLRDDLGINPLALDRSMLPDGTIPEMPKNLTFGHPKFDKLKEIMLEHFNKAKQENKDTRAIVFCEYRESVNLVHCLLLQCRPLINAQMFVGKGASGKDGKAMVSQKQQLRTMRSFRSGACNALVATCVAEEGLDVGSVDLILCFDISNTSPIRLVQRCGRTGRERGGQVYILVTEGREHQTLQECMRQRDGLNKKIQTSHEVQASLFAASPRLVPHGFVPQCQKMFLTVKKPQVKDKDDKKKKGQKDLRTMLLGRASSSSSSTSNNIDTNIISEEDFKEMYPEGYREKNLFENTSEYWAKNKDSLQSLSKCEKVGMNLSTWLEWQRTLQKTINIGHSRDTEILASLLQYSDAKRFDMPASTQNPSFATQDFATQNTKQSPAKTTKATSSPAKLLSPAKPKQNKKKPKLPIIKSPGKRDGDIRALFSTATKSTKNYTKLINDLGIQNDGSFPTSLVNLLVDLSLNNHNNTTKTCYVCANVCDCVLIKNLKVETSKPAGLIMFLKEPKLPDIDLIDDLDAETIMKCAKNDSLLDAQKDDNVSYLKVDSNNCSKIFDLEFDFYSPIDLTSPTDNTEAPKNENDNNFDIGDIEDIFADSSPEEAINKVIESKDKHSSDPKEALGFFGLDSIDDIFADSDDSLNNNIPKTPEKKTDSPIKLSPVNKTRDAGPNIKLNNEPKSKIPAPFEFPVSPSILSGKVKTVPSSPILCSQNRKFNLSTKKNQPQTSTPNSNVKRCLIPGTAKNINTNQKQTGGSSKLNIQTSQVDTTNKTMFTITQLVDMINKTDEKSILSKSNTRDEKQLHIEDDRSTSPILLTQAERKKRDASISSKNKTNTSQQPNLIKSLIVLESDSESENDDNDNTQVYDLDEKINATEKSQGFKTPDKSDRNQSNLSPFKSPVISKRKLSFEDSEVTESAFFHKRPKVGLSAKKLSLQQKVLAALTTNKISTEDADKDGDTKPNSTKDSNVSFVFSSNNPTQKENLNPEFNGVNKSTNIDDDDNDKVKDEYVRQNNLLMLQMFRRDSKVKSPKNVFESLLSPGSQLSGKRKVALTDSDDDFVDAKSNRNQPVNGYHKNGLTTNHKARKKKRKPNNELLDLEADLSGDQSDSGDELSDDSAGSIADFICDENVTHHADMQAIYIRSVKSPVRGVFKIPELPKKFERQELFSQFVEEDDYEMDSFCVDSHVGLTQANEISELEVVEMLLNKKHKKKKRIRSDSLDEDDVNENESPVVRKKKKPRRITSDSEDSS